MSTLHNHEYTEADVHRIVTQEAAAMLRRTLDRAATCLCTLGEACLNKALVALLKGEATEFQQQMIATILDMHIIKDGLFQEMVGEDISNSLTVIAREHIQKVNGKEEGHS